MYVRWKRREIQRSITRSKFQKIPENIVWRRSTAYLVENHRLDGKPRQKIIAYLGTFSGEVTPEGRYHMQWAEVERFWLSIDSRLEKLKIPPEQREKIETAITRKLRRLKDWERESLQRNSA